MIKSKYFTKEEFECPHCHKAEMNDKFLTKLINARMHAKIPFIINSGYRCHEHNRDIGGVKNSAHTKGLAVDIKANNPRTRFVILKALIMCNFNRIGISENFIHVDDDTAKDENVLWQYYGE